jgi:hypothetical protein
MYLGLRCLFWRGARSYDPTDLHCRLLELKRGRDIEGLVGLLRHGGDEALRAEVTAALRTLTGRDLGPKARLWQRWLRATWESRHRSVWGWVRHLATMARGYVVASGTTAPCHRCRHFPRQSTGLDSQS